MPAIPPPLNALALLGGQQHAELARVPLDNRRVAAWLILLRDDDSCLWRERATPCSACSGRWPCIEPNAGSRSVLGRCQNCHYHNIPCERGDPDEEIEKSGTQANGNSGIRKVRFQTPGSMRSVSAPGTYLSARVVDSRAARFQVIAAGPHTPPQDISSP